MTRIRFTDELKNDMTKKELNYFEFEIGEILANYEECCERSGVVLLYASSLSTSFYTHIGVIETEECCGLTRSRKIIIPNEEVKRLYRESNIMMLIESEWTLIDVD